MSKSIDFDGCYLRVCDRYNINSPCIILEASAKAKFASTFIVEASALTIGAPTCIVGVSALTIEAPSFIVVAYLLTNRSTFKLGFIIKSLK
ncbi:MAG TPA: hypothetical protein PLC27_06140 [Saprospiraceae bacterium]|nr:hypothetical protein [Saprospiraceae bacterium]